MTEQQPYDVVRRTAAFELRRYPAHVVAEVEVLASFDRAGNAAFRRLFGYISGANTARRSVPMTAPVVQGTGGSGAASSRTVPMTAPVVQRGPVAADPDDRHPYTVAFVLPADMTEDSAPEPTDEGVTIRTVPASLAAALRFSGSGSGAAFAKRTRGAAGRDRCGRADPGRHAAVRPVRRALRPVGPPSQRGRPGRRRGLDSLIGGAPACGLWCGGPCFGRGGLSAAFGMVRRGSGTRAGRPSHEIANRSARDRSR